MSTTPTEPVGNEPTAEQVVRMTALQYASMMCTKETPLKEFLMKAKDIEEFIVNGDVRVRDREGNVETSPPV